MDNRFKNNTGQHYLRPLFYEYDLASEKSIAIYTLKDNDYTINGVTYPSLRRLYVNTGDLSEYRFAVSCLDGWSHWKKIRNANWFQPYYQDWREELEVSVMSQALLAVRLKADNPEDKDNLSAARFLLSGQWVPKEKVGPRTKDKIKQEAEKLFLKSNDIDEDYDRVMQ